MADAKFKLPRYLKLAKGAMWIDIDGDNASGIRLYSSTKKLIGRGKITDAKPVPKDEFDNKNEKSFGMVEDKEVSWYFDTTTIDNTKLGNVIRAYKNGILEKADINKPPAIHKQKELPRNFRQDNKGDTIFSGSNKEMYKKLMNLKFPELKEFVNKFPKSDTSKNNLMDLFDYEKRGFNKFSRPRLEVLDLIRDKLKEYGPGMSMIRKNDLD